MVMTKSEALRVLEIDPDASAEQVRANYKRLALKWHPDKHNNSAEATLRFQEISEAYKRLTSTTDDDNVKVSMGDMFDLFAHIFFTNGRYYATTNDHFSYSDDDDVGYMRSSDSSDDNIPAFRPRPRSKYCDLLSGRSVSSNKNIKQNNRNISEAEAMKNAEELIKEEERNKKKAEKKRAKKKRSRAKRKQREKEKKAGDDKQVENSNSKDEDENDGEEETGEGSTEDKKDTKEQNQENHGTTDKNGQNKQASEKSEEDSGAEHEEASWDTSSAFFANAARRGPVNNANTASETKSTSETTGGGSSTAPVQNHDSNSQTSRLERQKGDDEELDPVVLKSRQLAVQGNNLANDGKYEEAVGYFTKAISLHDCDFRFFGNRSYCFDRLGEFTKALEDAEVTISLAPVWPKGYFRKGRALAGLKQYADAEKAFSEVLKLDKHCEDARFELTRVRVQQLKDMGFGHAQSERAVRLYGTVHAALDALLSGKVQVKSLGVSEEETYVSDDGQEEDQRDPRTRLEDQCSLWVGNVNPKEVTERQLTHLFSKYGPVKFIRILPTSFCAFVNYDNQETAAKALQFLQGYSIGGQNLIIRYPNNEKNQRSMETGSKLSGPVNGDECYFWRTTGCVFGDKCRYTHVPAHKAIDLNKVEQKFGKIRPAKKGR